MDFVRVVILAPSGWLFEAWLLLGAVLAACGAGAWLWRRGVDPWSALLGA
jgi:hypothetical protein